jgi:SAM-dependent methyltransferase
MNNKIEFAKYKNIGYEELKQLAKNKEISMYERIGIPDSYRKGKELDIFIDILQKLDVDTDANGKTWLDIGPGCTELPLMVLDLCKQRNFQLLWADSKEMLDLLPEDSIAKKYQGYFPDDMADLVSEYKNKVDYLVCYSLLHCGPFYNTCIYKFIDAALSLLRPGGKMLIGDIPNISKRKRFFSTETGIEFHKKFMDTNDPPVVDHLKLEPGEIDDGIIMGILQRYRGFGFETYVFPQNSRLPMYNRREDILICKI